MLSSLCKQSGLICMKYKYRCKLSCIAKPVPFLLGSSSACKWQALHSTELHFLSQWSLLSQTQNLLIEDNFQVKKGSTCMAQSLLFHLWDASEHCLDCSMPGNNYHPSSLNILMINNWDHNVLLVLKGSNMLNYSIIYQVNTYPSWLMTPFNKLDSSSKRMSWAPRLFFCLFLSVMKTVITFCWNPYSTGMRLQLVSLFREAA